MLTRSGTSPSEPCEIANFDPIHGRVTTPVFPISILVDLSRSTARYAIGVSLFLLPPFFLSSLPSTFVHSLRESETATSVSLLETVTRARARGNRNRLGTGRASCIYIPRPHFQFFLLRSRRSRVPRRDLSAGNCIVLT